MLSPPCLLLTTHKRESFPRRWNQDSMAECTDAVTQRTSLMARLVSLGSVLALCAWSGISLGLNIFGGHSGCWLLTDSFTHYFWVINGAHPQPWGWQQCRLVYLAMSWWCQQVSIGCFYLCLNNNNVILVVVKGQFSVFLNPILQFIATPGPPKNMHIHTDIIITKISALNSLFSYPVT